MNMLLSKVSLVYYGTLYDTSADGRRLSFEETAQVLQAEPHENGRGTLCDDPTHGRILQVTSGDRRGELALVHGRCAWAQCGSQALKCQHWGSSHARRCAVLPSSAHTCTPLSCVPPAHPKQLGCRFGNLLGGERHGEPREEARACHENGRYTAAEDKWSVEEHCNGATLAHLRSAQGAMAQRDGHARTRVSCVRTLAEEQQRARHHNTG